LKSKGRNPTARPHAAWPGCTVLPRYTKIAIVTAETRPPTITRRARCDDAGPLALLAERTFRDAFDDVNSPEDMALHCEASYGETIQSAEIADPDRVTLVFEQDGRLLGYAQLRWGPVPGSVVANSPGEIQRLYVARECHGKGVAVDLMNASIEEMRRRRVDVVWLGVWERNPRAIAFYRKFGFCEVGEHVFQLGSDPQRDIVMARPMEA
jgi:ribosomal protein S18 acetylase RimI-like enzyme